ncbi:MAG: putative DNA repair protein MutK [Flavobacteriales bacterium]|jgi:predicted DNA repair protein MutK
MRADYLSATPFSAPKNAQPKTEDISSADSPTFQGQWHPRICPPHQPKMGVWAEGSGAVHSFKRADQQEWNTLKLKTDKVQMASGFFALFDDIAALMDDVAAMSKIATKKTAGILADDLAVNAEKASGFVASRELPVLWKIMKGSFLNKLIILPIAFLLSAFLPTAIVPILLIGGIYLAFEGVEKIVEYLFHKRETKQRVEAAEMTQAEILEFEKKKIKSAIIVDFILSVEIIIIALGSVVEQALPVQIAVVTIVAILATIGVYGLVGLLVRMDDAGYKLIATSKGNGGFRKRVGTGLVKTLPVLIRVLAVVGTIAMILVAGGIFVHNVHFLHDVFESWPSILAELVVGLVVGIVALFFVMLFKKVLKALKK